MVARVLSGAVLGIDAYIVKVEVDIASSGHPSFSIVGLSDDTLQATKERISVAIKNSGFQFPTARITASLLPTDIPKEVFSFDLPIAIGVLAATGQVESAQTDDFLLLGGLSSNGSVRSIKGALPIAMAAKTSNAKGLILPALNVKHAAIIDRFDVFPVKSLQQAVEFLNGKQDIPPFHYDIQVGDDAYPFFPIGF